MELPEGVLSVRAGPGANCSSIGSVIDLLFGTAIVAGAVYAAIVASLPDRPIEVVGEVGGDDKQPDEDEP